MTESQKTKRNRKGISRIICVRDAEYAFVTTYLNVPNWYEINQIFGKFIMQY